MKKILALLILITILASIPLVAAVNSKPPVSKIVFVHRLDGFAKPDGVGPPSKPPKPEPEDPTSYELLGKGVEWKSLSLEYVINPDNQDSLGETEIADAIITSAEVWDAASSSELFLDIEATSVTFDSSAEIDMDVRDTTNEIVFGTIDESNTIAMCVVWGIFLGPPSGRQILEFDIILNDYYTWGDAEDDQTVMDLRNIITHELGHALGLADLYDSIYDQHTMYGYADYGEIIKRDLYAGDIEGIQALYN